MYPELQVKIHRLGNRYLAVTEEPGGQEILRHEFQHETMHLTYLGPLWLVDRERLVPEEKRRLRDMLKGKASLTQVATQGWRLFQYLFGDGTALENYLSQHPDHANHQLTLVFAPEAAHLARQPWEYIFDGKHFPCLTGRLLLSRRPLTVHPIDVAPDRDAPLRILAVLAAPTDRVSIDATEELSILQTALEQWLARDTVKLHILPEATPGALLEKTGETTYHIIHYVGQATYHLPQHQGFLCFEDELGQAELLSGSQFPRFIKGQAPGLLTLAAGRRSQVGVLDAFQSIATELMDYEIPGVLLVPVSLPTPRAIILYRTLYGGIAEGRSVQESLHRTRVAMWQADRKAGNEPQRLEWGTPALYHKTADLTLVQPQSHKSTQKESHTSSPTPSQLPTTPLIGRTREIQGIRKAFREGSNIFYLLGGEGVGKHVFTSYIIEHLGTRSGATLTIGCREELNPLASLAKIADFWKTSLPDAGPQAADQLLDVHQAPFQRAQKAQQLLAHTRYILTFEDLDTWFGPGVENGAHVQNETMRQVLLGLLSEPGKALFFFTAGQRWEDLNDIAVERRREIQLPLLSFQHTTQLINRLPVLRLAADSTADKQAVYAQVGGHPGALRVLDRWLMLGNSLQSLDAWGPTEARSPKTWVDLLTEDILAQMDPGEYDVLQALSILTLPFTRETIADLTQTSIQYTQPLLDDWLCFGLAEITTSDGATQEYRPTSPVRRVILAKLGAADIKSLHLQAAKYYAAPYYDAARRQVLARNITSWTEDRIGWLARDASGILGMRLREEQTTKARTKLLESTYAWQYHLTQGGNITAATQIIQTLAPVLNQQGQRDLSHQLLQRTLNTGSADQRTGDEMASFVRLQLEEGPLTTALNVYEDIYRSLDPDEAGIQRAYVLLRTGNVKQRLEDFDAAVKAYTQAMRIAREEESQEAEAECHYKLATAYRERGDLQQALVYSQAAKERYEALTYPNNLAIVEREQGLILEGMDRPESALKCFATSLQICRQLGDRQCIADNLTDIGRLFERIGRTEMAIQVIEEALQHYEYLRKPEHGAVLSLLEKLYAHKQRINEARARLRASKGRN